MVVRRNRAHPAGSLKERLLKFAEEARAAAKFIAAGPERDSLMKKAVKAEELAHAAGSLALRSDGAS